MRVKEIMTREPACCSSDTPLGEVARLMVEYDCGEIPVIDSDGRPIGVITDRDITCRTVAKGQNPLEIRASDIMSSPCVTVRESADISECCRILEDAQIRRAPVVDKSGRCCGMISQADVAQSGAMHETASLVRAVSQPTGEASAN